MKCVLWVSYAGPILISNSDNKELMRAKERERGGGESNWKGEREAYEMGGEKPR